MTLITGPAGFIGSALTHHMVARGESCVLLDKLTYAGHYGNIEKLVDGQNVHFVEGDIGDYDLVLKLLKQHKVRWIMNLAAESHVDNSILGPEPFIKTNILGTFHLLEAARTYWTELNDHARSQFRFLHVSTDEVFGELGDTGHFTEKTPYSPNSPYSASKASSDHLVRAWHHTYGLPVIISNCSNNYGPRQFPEKLIPRMIDCALNDKNLPVYGKGENIRDWIHVEDHARGLVLALERGKVGESYCFGGRSERKNLDVVRAICTTLDELKPRKDKSGKPMKYEELITFVQDRAGHDWRYAIDDTKAEKELGFERQYKNFEEGLRQTISWYMDNQSWVSRVKTKQ